MFKITCNILFSTAVLPNFIFLRLNTEKVTKWQPIYLLRSALCLHLKRSRYKIKSLNHFSDFFHL